MIRFGSLLLGVAIAIGCGSSPAPPPQAEDPPSPRTLTVGRHQVRLAVPAGWQHYDQGSQHRFERGRSHISLADLGPAMRDGLRLEIESSRELLRRGLYADARDLLSGLRPRAAFPSEQEWKAFLAPWRVLERLGERGDPDLVEIEETYVEVLSRINALPAADLSTVAMGALADDPMRDVAEQGSVVVDGRDAVRIDTWDRLSHTMRKSHLVVLNDGNILIMRMELGEFAKMQSAFDALVASMELPSPQLSAR